jgi:hypothetical protein
VVHSCVQKRTKAARERNFGIISDNSKAVAKSTIPNFPKIWVPILDACLLLGAREEQYALYVNVLLLYMYIHIYI